MASSFEQTKLKDILEKIARDEGFGSPNFNITSATNPGENFITQVFRVKIEDSIQEKCLSLILKVSSPISARKEMLSNDLLFRTETEMYEIILPALNDLLKKHGLSSSPIFPGTPRCYLTALSSSSDESDVIVLEDKQVDGFSLADIRSGLSAVECRMALEKLALLHSSFWALRELEPETVNQFRNMLDKGLYEKEDDPVIADYRQSYRNGLDFLGEPYVKGSPVYEKLYKVYEDFKQAFEEAYAVPEDLACINHGDFWANNVLFKMNKEDGKPEDACLIDFQLASLLSPVNDIAYFIFLGTLKEVRDEHFDELIEFYFNEVTKTLQGCGCDPDKIITWDVFSDHLQRYSKIGVYAAIAMLAILMADKSEFADIHSQEEEARIFSDAAKITNPETLKKLTQRLNDCVETAEMRGYI